jgi:hypothetical protein
MFGCSFREFNPRCRESESHGDDGLNGLRCSFDGDGGERRQWAGRDAGHMPPSQTEPVGTLLWVPGKLLEEPVGYTQVTSRSTYLLRCESGQEHPACHTYDDEGCCVRSQARCRGSKGGCRCVEAEEAGQAQADVACMSGGEGMAGRHRRVGSPGSSCRGVLTIGWKKRIRKRKGRTGR